MRLETYYTEYPQDEQVAERDGTQYKIDKMVIHFEAAMKWYQRS